MSFLSNYALCVCIAPGFAKREWCRHFMISTHKIPSFEVHCSASEPGFKAIRIRKYSEDANLTSRRSVIGSVLVMSAFGFAAANANGAGLPPEQKSRLCDDVCEQELENVW